MTIRSMTRNDIPAVLMLMNELSLELGEDESVDEETMHEHYEAMHKNGDMYLNLVLEVDKQVLGFMSLLFYRSFLHHKGTALINELIVQKEFRDRNYGKELLGFGISKAKELGLDEIEVGVMKDNVRALEFYKRNGLDLEYQLLGMEL